MQVTIQTNMGAIKLELDFENTPITAKNFVDYANSGFYEGTIFHRVIDNFMVQGGGLTPDMQSKENNAPIENEADKGGANKRGTVAMARTGDPHSATSQFFINVVDNSFLNHTAKSINGWGYCVFGEVVEGMEVVDAIKEVKTTTKSGHENVPVEDILIEKVLVEESATA